MNIVRWEPLGNPVSLRKAMDRLFEDSFVKPTHALAPFSEGVKPAIDMYQTPSEVVVKATMPGIKPDDVEINITEDTLTIKGEVNGTEEIKKEDYLYREHHKGSLVRSITLPHALQTGNAEATTEDGILTITIPKAEDAKPRTIQVKAKKAIEGKKKEEK